MAGLPELGRWIQYSWKNTDNNRLERCKVVEYEDVESFGWTLGTGSYQETEKQVVLVYEGGDTDSQDANFFKMVNWSYITEPGKEELETAVQKRNNDLLGYSCEACKSTSSKLLKCQACKKVHYCDQVCQRNDWPTHEAACVREKIVLEPNPRYPLAEVKQQLAISQREIQMKANAALVDGLNGRFKIEINGQWVRNPRATDLETLNRYMLKHDSGNDDVVHFKQRALESSEHTNGEPSSCSFFMTMEMCLEEKKYKEGGLHYLAVDDSDPGNFWGMVLNFNTFGTVAPFHTNCCCNFPKMPPLYKKMRKNWDKIFSRAKTSSSDVQCMFADTPFGCHSYGLEGDAGCKFKHDIAVKKPK